MKRLVKSVCSFAVGMIATCGLVCAVASATNPNSTTGQYAYMSGTIESVPYNKGIVGVKNTSNITRYIEIESTILGNNANSVASGAWIRQSKEYSGAFSAKAIIRANSLPTSAKVETLNLTVN